MAQMQIYWYVNPKKFEKNGNNEKRFKWIAMNQTHPSQSKRKKEEITETPSY